jgi:hypothetical protein
MSYLGIIRKKEKNHGFRNFFSYLMLIMFLLYPVHILRCLEAKPQRVDYSEHLLEQQNQLFPKALNKKRRKEAARRANNIVNKRLGLCNLPVSFDASMQRSRDFNKKNSFVDADWRLLRKLYVNFQKKLRGPNKRYTIPRRIHFIWLGSPLPKRYAKNIETWKKFHPDWKFKVWTDKDVKPFKLYNKAAFDAAKNYGEKSDIWRYEILYRYGGLYVDTDFECLKPFESFHHNIEFYAGIDHCPVAQVNNALIGSRPKHPILKSCIKNIQQGPGDSEFHRILNQTGPIHFTYCFMNYVREHPKNVVALPVTVVFPYPSGQRGNPDLESVKKRWVKKESYALHYWDMSWVGK